MKFTGYKGPWNEHGFPARKVADDGSVWREATPKELAEAPGDLLVFFGHGNPLPVSHWADYEMPGGVPFLPAFAALVPVYVRDEPCPVCGGTLDSWADGHSPDCKREEVAQ